MTPVIEYLTRAIREARLARKLSQRALSRKVGMPQAQISKIENAAVDPKISTLIALARALDLEVVLVPRHYVPAVTVLLRTSQQAGDPDASPRPAYALDDEEDDG